MASREFEQLRQLTEGIAPRSGRTEADIAVALEDGVTLDLFLGEVRALRPTGPTLEAVTRVLRSAAPEELALLRADPAFVCDVGGADYPQRSSPPPPPPPKARRSLRMTFSLRKPGNVVGIIVLAAVAIVLSLQFRPSPREIWTEAIEEAHESPDYLSELHLWERRWADNREQDLARMRQYRHGGQVFTTAHQLEGAMERNRLQLEAQAARQLRELERRIAVRSLESSDLERIADEFPGLVRMIRAELKRRE